MLLYRNTCWVTTVLYAAEFGNNCFSPAAWDLQCVRRAGIHRVNPKHKAKEAELI